MMAGKDRPASSSSSSSSSISISPVRLQVALTNATSQGTIDETQTQQQQQHRQLGCWQKQLQQPPSVSPQDLSDLPTQASPAVNRSSIEASTAVATTKPAEAGPEHAAGDRILYWSSTHKVWIRSVVIGVSRNPDNAVLAYDLDCKVGAEPSCVRMEPADGEHAENVRPREEASTAKSMTIQQDPQTSEPVDSEKLSVGDRVEYCSLTSNKWLRARVLKIYRKSGYCDLDIKRGAPLDRLRRIGDASTGFSTGATIPDVNKVATEKAAGDLAATPATSLNAPKTSDVGDSGATPFIHTSSKAKPPSPPPRRSAPHAAPRECDLLSDSSESSHGGVELTEIQEWERWKARQLRGQRNWAELGGNLQTTNGTLQRPAPKAGADHGAKQDSPHGTSAKVASLLALPQALSGGTGRRCRRDMQSSAPSQNGACDSIGSRKRESEKQRTRRPPCVGQKDRPFLRRSSPTLSPMRSLSSSPAILRRPRRMDFLRSPTPLRIPGINRERTLSPMLRVRRRPKDQTEDMFGSLHGRRSPVSVLAKRPPCRRRSPSSEPTTRQWRQVSKHSDGSSGSPLPRRPRCNLSSSSPRRMVKRDVGRHISPPQRPVLARTAPRSRSRSIRYACRQERLSSPPGPTRPWRRKH